MRIKRRKLQINITLDKDLVEAIDEGCLRLLIWSLEVLVLF